MTVDAMVGIFVTVLLAVAAGAYKLGQKTKGNGKPSYPLLNGSSNGNGKIDLSQYMTKELCVERHNRTNEKLEEIKLKVDKIPEIVAWINENRTKQRRRRVNASQ